jgi:hypothetical protein
MNRSTLARRYAPLAVIAALQLVIIATVPSTASNSTSSQVSAGNGGTTYTTGGQAGTPTNQSGQPGTQVTTAQGQPITQQGGQPGGQQVVSGNQTTGTIPPGVAVTGDTTHCAAGREFSAAVAYWAPPCVPGTPGATGVANGGSTSQGVTANAITVVDYNGDAGAEVDAILQAEGLYVSYSQAQTLDRAFQNFINKYFVLYGRRVNIITYQGQCTTVPPDTNCLIPEMDKIAAQYHPYIVIWNTTLCSACFAELARDKVVTMGGSGFSDDFANQIAPYFYAVSESSTRIEQAFAEFYCKQLAHSPVKWGGTTNHAQDFNGKPRVLGVLSTNDPDNENTVEQVLFPALKRGCGVTVSHTYYYAQDINTAAQQVAAGIAKMDTPTNPATTVVCLCDAVAPQFLYEGEKGNNYWPENVIASDQGIDLDKAAQSYEGGISCVGGKPCAFDLAFGVNPDGPEQPNTNDEGTRIFALGGGATLPVDALAAEGIAQIYVMLGNLIENTGPDLTAANMQARAPALPAVGGGATQQALLQFAPGNWSWEQDARVAYWDPNLKSSFNGSPGTFVSVEGNRFNLGQFPTLTEPPIPTPRP